MNEDLKGTMFDTNFDEYARWTNSEREPETSPTIFFDGLDIAVSSLMRRNALPYTHYSHEASEILRDVPRRDLLSIASRRKGYG